MAICYLKSILERITFKIFQARWELYWRFSFNKSWFESLQLIKQIRVLGNFEPTNGPESVSKSVRLVVVVML